MDRDSKIEVVDCRAMPEGTPVVATVIPELVSDRASKLATAVDAKGRELALRGAGLDRVLLYETVRDGLRAETVVYDRYGKEMGRVPDHNVRAKYINAAVEILGEKADKEQGSRIPTLVVVLPDGRKV